MERTSGRFDTVGKAVASVWSRSADSQKEPGCLLGAGLRPQGQAAGTPHIWKSEVGLCSPFPTPLLSVWFFQKVVPAEDYGRFCHSQLVEPWPFALDSWLLSTWPLYMKMTCGFPILRYEISTSLAPVCPVSDQHSAVFPQRVQSLKKFGCGVKRVCICYFKIRSACFQSSESHNLLPWSSSYSDLVLFNMKLCCGA